MPTTAENITQIRYRCPNYSRAEILAVMNDIYEEVYSVETEQTLYIDSSTGMPPFLATTAGTYQYDCPSNCRRTAAVFTNTPRRDLSRARPVGPRKEYYFRGNGYYKEAVNSRDALPDGTLATVTFQDDPGTTTDKYYHAYYLLVAPLDTEDVELILPSWTHRQLRRATIAALRSEDYGENGSEEKIIEDAARKIRNQLNRGVQARVFRTPVPEEYQILDDDYDGYR